MKLAATQYSLGAQGMSMGVTIHSMQKTVFIYQLAVILWLT